MLVSLANGQKLTANSQKLSLYVHDLTGTDDVDACG